MHCRAFQNPSGPPQNEQWAIFSFADRSQPALPPQNDAWVDSLTPDYLVEHSLFALFVKCTDNRHRFDDGVVGVR